MRQYKVSYKMYQYDVLLYFFLHFNASLIKVVRIKKALNIHFVNFCLSIIASQLITHGVYILKIYTIHKTYNTEVFLSCKTYVKEFLSVFKSLDNHL